MALLRDALVSAAAAERGRPEPIPTQPRSSAGAEQGELLWAYCVLRASDRQPHGVAGVGGAGGVEPVQAAGLVALVGRVPRAEFGAESLQRNLNDLGWLERVARAHEAVLEQALAMSTIVPMRMCTLYENADSVRRMLEREQEALTRALETLDGRREWGVKMLADPARLMESARRKSADASALEPELETRGEGGAYLLRRRLERELRELADSLAAEVAAQVHARLQDWAIDAVTRPAQNRELSGHEGEMLLNGAYLVDADRIDELRRLIGDLEVQHRELGVRIELTGPWPPYNFVPGPAATGV
ncbi:MAG TPA: GvpL/GvpF family gas vesicle protein [Solirubrobacteraceae bacterium]